MRRQLSIILAVGVMLLLPSSTRAWSGKGHRIIARLAWERLSSETQKKVSDLLGNGTRGMDPLSSVASWADEQKSAKSRLWHSVNIPLNAPYYDRRRDCRNNDCLIAAIERFKHQLQASKNRQERIDALKYLVHLMGDLHQPLHCADNNDAGGSKMQVTFFGKVSDLRAVWDRDMIDRTGLDEASYIKKLDRSVPADSGGWIEDWAWESHGLAKSAYQLPPDKALSTSYYRLNLPIVDRQLARAAMRLNKILQLALG